MMHAEASQTPRRIEPLEAVRLIRLARQCPHRVPLICVWG
jgi:hypothetical protein